MPILTIPAGNLPLPTKQYLHNLIINRLAANAPSEPFTQNPDGIAGTTKKFASALGLAVGGWAAGAGGGADPGRFRLLRHIHTRDRKIVWIYAEHLGRSSYTFKKIILPTCGRCCGTTEIICTACNGTNMRSQGDANPRARLSGININRDLRSCTTCNGARVIDCTSCKPAGGLEPFIFQGESIKRNVAQW
jgi:hypothetical protein